MSSQLPSLISLDQYLADSEPAPIPDLTWDEAQAILAESDDVETQVTVVHALARKTMPLHSDSSRLPARFCTNLHATILIRF